MIYKNKKISNWIYLLSIHFFALISMLFFTYFDEFFNLNKPLFLICFFILYIPISDFFIRKRDKSITSYYLKDKNTTISCYMFLGILICFYLYRGAIYFYHGLFLSSILIFLTLHLYSILKFSNNKYLLILEKLSFFTGLSNLSKARKLIYFIWLLLVSTPILLFFIIHIDLDTGLTNTDFYINNINDINLIMILFFASYLLFLLAKKLHIFLAYLISPFVYSFFILLILTTILFSVNHFRYVIIKYKPYTPLTENIKIELDDGTYRKTEEGRRLSIDNWKQLQINNPIQIN